MLQAQRNVFPRGSDGLGRVSADGSKTYKSRTQRSRDSFSPESRLLRSRCCGVKCYGFRRWVTLCQAWNGRDDNPLLPLLEGVLACDSYRQVVQILQHHPWVDRQAIYELRTQARKNVPMSHELSHYNFHNPGRWYPGRWHPGIAYLSN